MSLDSGGEFLVRVGVVLVAARGYYDDDRPERHRLALILLDSASELLLRHSTEGRDMWFRFGELMAGQNSEAVALGMEPPHAVHAMTFPSGDVSEKAYGEPVYVSRTQRRKLDREFGPNVDVALFFGQLTPVEAKALKHLHEYRNGAYHRNVVNLQVVKILVQLQLLVVASTLRSTPVGPTRIYPPIDLEPVRAELGLSAQQEPSFVGLANILEREIHLDAGDVSEALGSNLSARSREVKRRVEAIQEQMATPGVTFEDWVALIQTPQPWPVGFSAIRSLRPPVTASKLKEWQTNILTCDPSESALDAFVRFVDVDTPLTDFEDAVERVEVQLDREIQRLIDERRGK